MTIYTTDEESPAYTVLEPVTACDIANRAILRPALEIGGIITTTAELPHGGTWACMDLGEFARSDIQTPAVWLMNGKLGWLVWFPVTN